MASTTLIAMPPTNSPASPGISTMGMNARAVVRVEPPSGTARARTEPPTAASTESPLPSRVRTSSTMTIALSIIRPRAMISPVTDIWFIGMPYQRMAARTISEVKGSAAPTTSAERQPIVNRITTMTRAAPSRKLPARPDSRSFV